MRSLVILLCPLLFAACRSGPAPSGSLPPGAKPFGGRAWSIPGVIEAECFNEGKDGEAFHDLDPENQGAPYRVTTVDVEERKDASGGYGVGWTRAGEWLTYTVNVKQPGEYRVEVPAASAGIGGVFHIEMDGKDVTGPITVPDTGSWQTLQLVVVKRVKLTRGVQTMKVVMDTDGETKSIGDMDLFRFTR